MTTNAHILAERISELESLLRASEAREQGLKGRVNQLTLKVESKERTARDLVLKALDALGERDTVVIRRSGDVSIKQRKGKFVNTFHAGHLFTNMREDVPLRSKDEIPAAFVIGFISFREFSTRSKIAPMSLDEKRKSRNDRMFLQGMKAVFLLWLDGVLDELVEANKEAGDDFDADFILANPHLFFEEEISTITGTNFYVDMADKSRVYFKVVEGEVIPSFYQDESGNRKSIA